MYLYNTWEETGDKSVECRALQKFLRQSELHKTGASCLTGIDFYDFISLSSFNFDLRRYIISNTQSCV